MRNLIQYAPVLPSYTERKVNQDGWKMISGVLYALLAGLMWG